MTAKLSIVLAGGEGCMCAEGLTQLVRPGSG